MYCFKLLMNKRLARCRQIRENTWWYIQGGVLKLLLGRPEWSLTAFLFVQNLTIPNSWQLKKKQKPFLAPFTSSSFVCFGVVVVYNAQKKSMVFSHSHSSLCWKILLITTVVSCKCLECMEITRFHEGKQGLFVFLWGCIVLVFWRSSPSLVTARPHLSGTISICDSRDISR